jgi:hypothetical protein
MVDAEENKGPIEDNRNNIAIMRREMQQHFLDDKASFERVDHASEDMLKIMRDGIEDQKRVHKEMGENIEKLRIEIKPLCEWFSGLNFTKKILLAILAVIASLLGIALGIKQLF